MKNVYQVAEHLFSIEAESEKLALLTNYEPFLIAPDAACGELLFALQVMEEPWVELPDSEQHHVYTDTSDEDMPRIEIYRLGEALPTDGVSGSDERDWLFQVSLRKDSPVCARFRASHDFRCGQLWLFGKDTRFAIDNAAMLLFAFASAKTGTLEMHASVTVREGRGYLFLGHSGTGKSTHSRLWQLAFEDAWLLNDDNPVVRLWPDGRVVVYGSPWSGKTPCYKNDKAPVGAIVKLSQAPQNIIRRLQLPEAYAYMLSSSSGLKIMPEMMDALYDTISRLIQITPLFGLECLPDTDAAHVCYDAVSKA